MGATKLELSELRKLQGSWVYVLHDAFSNRTVYGKFQLQLKDGKPFLTANDGSCWYGSDTPSGSNCRGKWNGRTFLWDNKLYLIFKMQSATKDPEAEHVDKYEGVASFKIKDQSHMLGTYHDLVPRSQHYGTIECKKSSSSSTNEQVQANEAYKMFRASINKR